MPDSRAEAVIAGAWSIDVRAAFRPRGPDIAAYAELPAEIRPVPVRVVDLTGLPLAPRQAAEYMLSEQIVARLHMILAKDYPDLVTERPFRGFDGVSVRLGVRRLGGPLPEERDYSFAMSGDPNCPVPAVQVVFGVLDPWSMEERRKLGLA